MRNISPKGPPMEESTIKERHKELIASRNEHVKKFEELNQQTGEIRIKIEQLTGAIVALEEFVDE